MHTFFAKYRLTSCLVDKELIADIEKFILSETKEYLTSVENESNKTDLDSMREEMFHIYIQTKSDSQKYSSIADFAEDIFPDSVHTIVLDFNSYKNVFLNIRVIFHSSFSEHPVVEISMKAGNAKEICARFGTGIKSIVSRKRNTNHWYHNRTLLLSLLLVYTLWNVINYYVLTFTPSASPMHLANNILFNFLFALLTVWIIISIFLRPYITFRTARQTIISLGYNVFSILYLMILIVLFYNNIHH